MKACCRWFQRLGISFIMLLEVVESAHFLIQVKIIYHHLEDCVRAHCFWIKLVLLFFIESLYLGRINVPQTPHALGTQPERRQYHIRLRLWSPIVAFFFIETKKMIFPGGSWRHLCFKKETPRLKHPSNTKSNRKGQQSFRVLLFSLKK